MNVSPSLLISNSGWQSSPSTGFLTPTPFMNSLSPYQVTIYGGVRDKDGRSCIRSVVYNFEDVVYGDTVHYDRRGSLEFDSDGTILGHVYSVADRVFMIYVGFKKSKHVKFQAFSGLAVSDDGGLHFHFAKRILNQEYFDSSISTPTDIVACHWADLDEMGNGLALIAVGNGWEKIDNFTYPAYSSYLVNLERFEFASLVCRVPQKSEIYRLGRPRFLNGFEYKSAVLTGGTRSGDYRPYFFIFDGSRFIEDLNFQFPLAPGTFDGASKQLSYPELIRNSLNKNFFLFNGDNMGNLGCYIVEANL